MNPKVLAELRQNLRHTLWIGGGADAGKTTIADILVARLGWNIYHYDRTDTLHHTLLALTQNEYATLDSASLEERWVQPSIDTLVQRSLESFVARLPFVLSDLHMFTSSQPLLIEGFGLTPELIAPLLTHENQAIWLFPTPQFKLESMLRRDKPAFRHQTMNPELVLQKFLERDTELALRSRREAEARGFMVLEVDGLLSAEQLADKLEEYFYPIVIDSPLSRV